ncbi:MAG: PAS domain S-box protein [Deltaproteobacteria bacterium]|nr:PAS domain S-box protein [Deltaproteobacteria bacterium]
MEEKKRLVRFVLARVVVVSLFLISTAILDPSESGGISGPALTGLTRLVIATYLISILSLVLLYATSRLHRAITYLLIIWDLGLVTLLLLLTGGIASPYSFLYLLSIISASMLLSRREALYSASLCAILYGAIMDLHYFGRLSSIGLPPEVARHVEPGTLFVIIFVNIVAFVLTAVLTSYLVERLRASETALRKQEIDFEELERLNTSIVSNLSSGLLTINEEGRIRVFNPYAERLTGYSQKDVYDRPLPEVIPAFGPLLDSLFGPSQDEIEYRNWQGKTFVFGFKSVPIPNKEGTTVGAIIDFQDLTLVKKMKAELERADRLAAIGELSARIAHEIRNPLAAISGSVQLIAGGKNIDPQDKVLLDIVLRETERLNTLIKDFLAYARPTRPVKTKIRLAWLLGELKTLLAADQRFSAITIHEECPDELVVFVDGDQFRQVFWNLFVNAAEAMGGAGTITFRAVVAGGGIEANAGYPVLVTVADTGVGMAEEELARLFEPFHSTKPGGSGIGLAMVYRVIESHGGRIRATSVPGIGTEFTISLPGG